MTMITNAQITQNVADALQYISCFHPPDFIQAMTEAWEQEQSPAAKDALTQILVNSRLCAYGHRPICQDTGIVVVFCEIGTQCELDAQIDLDRAINQGVHNAYTDPHNTLRASIVSDPVGERTNTRDNTPAVIHYRSIPGDQIHLKIAAKGGGSENKARLAMLTPSDSVADWVIAQVEDMGAGWCPPGVLGIGIGGTAEKAVLLAKEALLSPIDIHRLKDKPATSAIEALRLELYEKINDLGIGAQGLGGLTTVLDVKILDYPTHAASLPVAIIPNCAATRHIEFSIDGSNSVDFTPPSLDSWPSMEYEPAANSKKIDLETVTADEINRWKPGDTLLLTGRILTGRDAAHKRLIELIENDKPLPVDLNGRFIYYVGPVDPVGDEVMGPAGPTTATRMDKFTDKLLDATGLLGMIGKAERGPRAIESIAAHGAVYLIAVGGAAYLVSKAIKKARVVAFEDLGMEAIYEFEVENMPVTVAVDVCGQSVHHIAPLHWRKHSTGNRP